MSILRPATVVALLGIELLATRLPAWAADTTPPTTPVVTDSGAYTSSSSSLSASWTSSDPESSFSLFQFQIRQDSAAGPIIVAWKSTASVIPPIYVTYSDLALQQGKSYYWAVRARNGAGLWSAIGYSNGIKVDTTAPTAPGQPREGSTSDLDYDADGSYTVYWGAASDAESGIAAYQVQERIGATGSWTTLTSSATSPKFSVSGRQHNTWYFYQARAKNRAGLWGPSSAVSDGMRVDKTGPSAVTVTDDGATTGSTTTLHASWTPASDPESGIAYYRYTIRRDSINGSTVVSWTSVGLATEVTRSGLSLLPGVTYYFSVQAINRAGWVSTAYSNGITVRSNNAPILLGVTPADGTTFVEGQAVQVQASAADSDGDPLEYQFLIDGQVKRPWGAGSSWTWDTTATVRARKLTVQLRDPYSQPVEKTLELFGYRKPEPTP